MAQAVNQFSFSLACLNLLSKENRAVKPTSDTSKFVLRPVTLAPRPFRRYAAHHIFPATVLFSGDDLGLESPCAAFASEIMCHLDPRRLLFAWVPSHARMSRIATPSTASILPAYLNSNRLATAPSKRELHPVKRITITISIVQDTQTSCNQLSMYCIFRRHPPECWVSGPPVRRLVPVTGPVLLSTKKADLETSSLDSLSPKQ